MKTYPVFLVGLAGRRCVVIGGDEEAHRKVLGLLEHDAAVTVIHPDLVPALYTWAQEGRIAWLQRTYQTGDLRGAHLVIATGKDPSTNDAIWQEAENERVLVNAVDDVAHCSFIAGSVVRRGALTIAISTGGCAPALAVRLRERLMRELGPEYAEFLELMEALREPLAQTYPDFETRRALWYALVDSDILDHLRAGRPEVARQRLIEVTGLG